MLLERANLTFKSILQTKIWMFLLVEGYSSFCDTLSMPSPSSTPVVLHGRTYDIACCTFQLVIFNCRCAKPGERILLRKGDCGGLSSCKPYHGNTAPSKIRECAECQTNKFWKGLLKKQIETHQTMFEIEERRARSVRKIKCTKCTESVDVAALPDHQCNLICTGCDASFESKGSMEGHCCAEEEVRPDEAWAIGPSTVEGKVVMHRRPPIVAQGRTRNGTNVLVKRGQQTAFSLTSSSLLSVAGNRVGLGMTEEQPSTGSRTDPTRRAGQSISCASSTTQDSSSSRRSWFNWRGKSRRTSSALPSERA